MAARGTAWSWMGAPVLTTMGFAEGERETDESAYTQDMLGPSEIGKYPAGVKLADTEVGAYGPEYRSHTPSMHREGGSWKLTTYGESVPLPFVVAVPPVCEVQEYVVPEEEVTFRCTIPWYEMVYPSVDGGLGPPMEVRVPRSVVGMVDPLQGTCASKASVDPLTGEAEDPPIECEATTAPCREANRRNARRPQWRGREDRVREPTFRSPQPPFWVGRGDARKPGSPFPLCRTASPI